MVTSIKGLDNLTGPRSMYCPARRSRDGRSPSCLWSEPAKMRTRH